MPKNTITLNAVSEVLKIHPRTVVRHLEDDVHTHWNASYNPDVSIEKLCEVFDLDRGSLNRMLSGKDEVMKQMEMAEFIDVSIRVFKRRDYPALIRVGRVVRYSRYDTTRYNVANYKI